VFLAGATDIETPVTGISVLMIGIGDESRTELPPVCMRAMLPPGLWEGPVLEPLRISEAVHGSGPLRESETFT